MKKYYLIANTDGIYRKEIFTNLTAILARVKQLEENCMFHGVSREGEYQIILTD